MADDFPSDDDQKFASAKFAKLILFISGIMLLGMIATDRSTASKIALRKELRNREFHALRMQGRAAQLRSGADLCLLNICYDTLAKSQPCSVTKDDLWFPDYPPIGLLGSRKEIYSNPPIYCRWQQPVTEVLSVINGLVEKLPPLIKTGDAAKIEENIRLADTSLIEQELMTVWYKHFPGRSDSAALAFLRLVMRHAEEKGHFGAANVACTIEYFWLKNDSTTLDAPAETMIMERTFGARKPAVESIPLRGWFLDGAGQSIPALTNSLLETNKPGLSEKEVSWLVTATIVPLALDPETDPQSLGLGYVEQPLAFSDLPVFSAAEFIGMAPDKVPQLIQTYRVDLEKMLMTKAPSEEPIEIFSSGIKLRISDLVIMAGIVIAVAQLFYVVAVSQEKSVAASFPRYGGSPDPMKADFPASADDAIQRIIYIGFLLIPTSLVFLGWLTGFKLSDVSRFFAPTSELWDARMSIATLAMKTDGGFTTAVYILAMAGSFYALHRIVLSQTSDANLRWSRLGTLWRASLATVGIASIVHLTIPIFARADATTEAISRSYAIGAGVLAVGAFVCYLFDWKQPKLASVIRLCRILVILLVGVTVISYVRTPWRPLYVMPRLFGNVLPPVFICWTALFAAIRRRQRFTTWYFSGVVILISTICLEELSWLWPFRNINH